VSNNNDEKSRLDSAARAAWLYFIGEKTQEEIARIMRISRPTAQRLVSLARSERLITFRFKNPILSYLELADRLTSLYRLAYCEVVPVDPTKPESLAGVATSAAGFIELSLSAPTPVVMALGTGRTLRAATDLVQSMDCPQHTLVALVGNIAPDGSASMFDVLSKLADVTKAKRYPIPLPVLADTRAERDQLVSLRPVRRVHELAARADITLVGVGQMDLQAPQFVDGFITREELLEQIRLGAVGEITGWSFDAEGRILTEGINQRLTSSPARIDGAQLVIGVANGKRKLAAIHSALRGRLVNGLITDDETAEALVAKAAQGRP
jgi:DNA-binding transcriptional regulator LsrR (DeoR family)